MVKQMIADYTTPQERQYLRKAGKVYLKVAKTMGAFFLLSLILTSVALVNSDPSVSSNVVLQAGESVTFGQFYGEAGDSYQVFFAITQENGTEYRYEFEDSANNTASYEQQARNDWEDEDWENFENYEEYDHHHDDIEGPFELYQYMQQMDWLLQADLFYADNYKFENAEVVSSFSGEVMVIDITLPANGHYQLEVTNMHDTELTFFVVQTTANLALVGSAIVSWVVFGLTVALFTFMLQVGWWLIIAYVVIKAIRIIQEDNNNRRYTDQQVIGPDLPREE